MADVQPLVEAVRPGRIPAQSRPPVPGDRQQPRVQRLLEVLDRLRIRRVEIAVLPGTVAVKARTLSVGVRTPSTLPAVFVVATVFQTGQMETRGWPKRVTSGAWLWAVRKNRAVSIRCRVVAF